MQVSLTPELERAVQAKVATGLYSDASDVLREAMRCLLLRERMECGVFGGEPWTPDSLRAAVVVGAEEAERGEFVDQPMNEIFREIKAELGNDHS